MEKKLLKKIVGYLIGIQLLALLALVGFLALRVPRNIYDSMEEILRQEKEFYLQTENLQQEKLDFYVGDYTTRVTVADHLLTMHEELRSDEGMRQICNMLNAEEIHVFDQEGKIVLSSMDGAVGTKLLDNEDAGSFWKLLHDRDVHYVLEHQSGRVLECSSQTNYIAVASETPFYAMVMLGIDRDFSEEFLAEASAASIVRKIPTTKDESLFAVDAESGEVLGASKNNAPGLEITDIGDSKRVKEIMQSAGKGRILKVNGKPVFVKTKAVSDIVFLSMRRPGIQMEMAVWMILGIIVILTLNIIMMIFVIKRYFRKYIFDEIDGIRGNIEKIMHGEENVVFRTSEHTELASIADALNAWNRNIRNEQSKMNWCTKITSPNMAFFECIPYINAVYCSDNFLTLMQIDGAQWEKLGNDSTEFIEYIRRLTERQECTGFLEVSGRFLRIELHRMEQEYFGIIFDKTEEVMEQERTMRFLRKEAETDSLTGLNNRRGFEKKVRKFLEIPQQYQIMLMFDVDNFKLVNDTLGHPAGDAVLKRIADGLIGYFGENHVIARMGGDEFAVFFINGMPREELADILETLQCILREDLEDFGCALSVSIGAAWLQNRELCYEGLYRCADNALYSSKKEGKNRYTISTCCQEERKNEG